MISSRCSWRFAEVCVGSESVVKMAVSSAKVLRIVDRGSTTSWVGGLLAGDQTAYPLIHATPA